MLSNRPYLLRAFYQWIVDSDLTPILVVDAKHPRCKVPQEYIEDGEIVFNISNSAIRDLNISNEAVTFKASFSSVIHIISAPIAAVLAIYAEENGEGIFFDGEEESSGQSTVQLQPIEGMMASKSQTDPTSPLKPPGKGLGKTKPFLRLVE